MTKSKKWLVVIIVVIIILGIGGIYLFMHSEPKTAGEVVNLDRSDIQGCSIYSLESRNTTKLTDEQVDTLYNDIKDISVEERDPDLESPAYALQFTIKITSKDSKSEEDAKEIGMISEKEWVIEGYRYYIPEASGKKTIDDIKKMLSQS